MAVRKKSAQTKAKILGTKRRVKPTVDRTKLKTYIALILDRSGSMSDVKGATIEAFNQQAKTIRQNAGEAGETFVSLVTFATDVQFAQWHAPAELVQDLTPSSYWPNGGTAMNDAIGQTVNRLLNETPSADPNSAYLVIVVTDGLENSSRTYGGATISALVSGLQANGRWTFTVAGANIDLRELSKTLSIPYANTYTFTADNAGIQLAGCANSIGTSNYLQSRGSRGISQVKTFYADPNITGGKTP